jgi:hypothetical protein
LQLSPWPHCSAQCGLGTVEFLHPLAVLQLVPLPPLRVGAQLLPLPLR